MTPRPISLKREGDDFIVIEWSDNHSRVYSIRELRDNCPCALCKEQRRQKDETTCLPIVESRDRAPIRIAQMMPQGNYAYQIVFSDGHGDGLYSLSLLRELGKLLYDDTHSPRV